jgi:putative transposase
MPLKEKTIVDLREEMAKLAISGRYTVSEAAELFGVSRPTVRMWRDRFVESGRAGLEDRSHAPHSCPHRTPEAIEELIVATRLKWGWGSKKILRRLQDEHPGLDLPSRAAIDSIFNRHNLVQRARKRAKPRTPFARRYHASEPGELTTIDHKGQFRLLNGRYCYALTMADAVSRYVLACKGLDSTSLHRAWPVIERVLREYGLPKAIQSDNGPPFGASGLGRLSTLSVRLMKLGIQPIFIDPGHPEQNGIHERMHRTLKAATTRPPGRNFQDQQNRFDRFVQEYNFERPHEAIGLDRPAHRYRPSPRPYPNRIKPPEYPPHFELRRVSNNGSFKWKSQERFISEALRGELIGLEPVDEALWTVHFYGFQIAKLDETTGRAV